MSERFLNYIQSLCKPKPTTILTFITTERTSNYFLWLNRETARKMLTQTFFFPNSTEIETDPVESSRRQENKLTKYRVVVKSTKPRARLPTCKSCLPTIQLCDLGEADLTSLCFRLFACKKGNNSVWKLL